MLLLKLAYNYLDHTAKPNTDFRKYPTAIAEVLGQNNHEKLLPQNIQTIREVFSKVQHEYRNAKENDEEVPVKDAENTGYPFKAVEECPRELYQFEDFL